MSNTLNLGTDGNWGVKKDSLLGYNSENGNFKPLPFDFTRASSATVINKDGLIETVGSGEPRIDYKDDSKGALKLEPSRSNLIKSSGDISTQSTYWLPNQGGTSVQNATTAPDGSNTASQINTFGQQYGGITQGSISVSNTEYTYSVYLKAKNGTPNIRLIFFDGATFHSSDFTISSEWKRYDYKFTPVSGSFQIYITCPNVEASFYSWGAQLEQGSYATSYIPTQGSAVTRVADVCNNGANEQVINSTEGVLYAEMSKSDVTAGEGGIRLSKDINNEIRLNFATNNRLNVFVNVGGSNQIYYDNTNYNLSDYHKIAIKYKLNDYAIYVDGTQIHTETSATVSTGLDKINYSTFYGKTKEIKLYNTALTDQELINLTTI